MTKLGVALRSHNQTTPTVEAQGTVTQTYGAVDDGLDLDAIIR